MTIPPLPDHLSIRRPTLADLADVLNLYNSFDIPKYGQPNQSLESIQNIKRGKRVAHLSVDSESPTGATRLYEHVGMHITVHHDLYQKTLRGA